MTTTLLAVDDSKTMRRVLEITFAGEDYRVVLADSAADAISKLHSDRPAVALVDARLGNDSGYDLCQRIKQESPQTRVLVLSSKHQPYDRGRGSSSGVDDFMDKPFDTQQLIDKVGALARKAGEALQPPPGATPYRSAPQPSLDQASARPRAPTLAYGATREPTPPQPPVQPRPTAQPSPTLTQPIAPTPVTGVQLGRDAPAPVQAPRPAVPSAVPAAVPAAAAAAAVGGNGKLTERLADLGLTKDQVEGVLALSREIVEQVVWEVVPQLAETLIQEEIRRLTSE